jgi:prepilin-type N-terminal cleavage/methylation domain-containing protein
LFGGFCRPQLKTTRARADGRPITRRANQPAHPSLRTAGRVTDVLRREDGLTLIECLAVILLLGILLGPLVGSFVTVISAEARQGNVVIAQENARLALQRMRKDIHCAHSVGAPLANSSGGTTIVLNETNVSGTAECPGLLALNSSSVQWCTVPVAGFANRYQLFREDDPDTSCNGSQSTFEVDYVTQASVWSTPACTGGEYPTVSVSLGIDVATGTTMEGSYNLDDQIALRNATPCT